MSESPLRKYRFWPIYGEAFARTFGYNIYNLALPNYLLYIKQFDESLVGLIVSMFFFGFLFGPFIAKPITERIGVRKAVIFSSIMSVTSIGCQILFFDPILLLIFRAIDGLCTGFFWPNLQMEVSNWQRVSPRDKSDQYFQVYAMSWNYGILIGGIVGFFIVFFGAGNEYFALIFAWVSLFSMIICAFSIEPPNNKLVFHHGQAMVYLDTQICENQENDDGSSSKESSIKDAERDENAISLLKFPASFFLIGTLIYTYLKSFYPLAVPIVFAREGIASYMVYIVTFFHQIVQMVAVTLVTRRNAKVGYESWLYATFFNIMLASILWIISPGWLLALAFIINGFLCGFLYSFTSKIMLQYGSSSKSLKYVTYYEFFNGIGFGSAPVLVGFIAEISMTLNYAILFVFIVVTLLILLKIGQEGRESFKKPSKMV